MKVTGIDKSKDSKTVLAWKPMANTKFTLTIHDHTGRKMGSMVQDGNYVDLSALKEKPGTYTISIATSPNGEVSRATFVITSDQIKSVRMLEEQEEADPSLIPNLGDVEHEEELSVVPPPASTPAPAPAVAPTVAPTETTPETVVENTVTRTTRTVRSGNPKKAPKTPKAPDGAKPTEQTETPKVAPATVTTTETTERERNLLKTMEEFVEKIQRRKVTKKKKAAPSGTAPAEKSAPTTVSDPEKKADPVDTAQTTKVAPTKKTFKVPLKEIGIALGVIAAVIVVLALITLMWPRLKSLVRDVGVQGVNTPTTQMPVINAPTAPVGTFQAHNAPLPEPTEIIEVPPRQYNAANHGGLSLNQSISIVGSNTISGPLIINNFNTNQPSVVIVTNVINEVVRRPRRSAREEPAITYQPQQQPVLPGPQQQTFVVPSPVYHYSPPPVYYNYSSGGGHVPLPYSHFSGSGGRYNYSVRVRSSRR